MESIPVAPNPIVNGIIQRHTAADARRKLWEDLLDEVYTYMLPERFGWFESSRGDDRMADIFDDTGMNAIDESAAIVIDGTMPQFAPWFRFDPGSSVPKNQKARAKRELRDVTEYVMELLNYSTFYDQMHAAMVDYLVGTAYMGSEPSRSEGVDFLTRAPRNMWHDTGVDGRVDATFRKRSVKVRDLKEAYPAGKFSQEIQRWMNSTEEKDLERSITLLEACYQNWKVLPELSYEYYVIEMSGKTAVDHEVYAGVGSKPIQVWRYAADAEEDWGRGPALRALPNVRLVNRAEELFLENADAMIGGIWIAADDSTINTDTFRIETNRLMMVPRDSQLQNLAPHSAFDINRLLLDQKREAIRRTFMIQDYGPLGKTPMSATEVAARQQKLAQIMGPAFGRLLRECVWPILTRILYLEREAGRVQIPRIGGRTISVVATSAMAMAHNTAGVNNLVNYSGATEAVLGPQAKQAALHPLKTIKYLADKYNIDPDLVPEDADITKLIAQIFQQSQAQGPGMGADNVVPIQQGALP